MPGITFDITKCSIAEDQQRVATQWTKTFIHNPPDEGKHMAQLIMACLGRGDFKVRDFMSNTSDLLPPSQHLTIADYLSHGSRIIIDYNSLSEVHVQELLAYFPDPSPSNKVFSRSATHDVNQGNEHIVEGKGFMLGVKGQLPAVIKTPRDFGINIAMGGAGQDNYNGKKIAANGFSGHFYFHRNTEHKLLLAGLEQSAPSSAMSLLVGSEKYPEEEQQGHDQFGQGHSLTGASDTYTAAGSLYFSDPMYQAKLFLEKGVFPPAKYGAMQVTLTNDNWPQVKECLEKIRATAESGNEEDLAAILLEKPSTAAEREVSYSSYIALDFSAYLKQAYKVFIESSALPDEEKSNLLQMQGQLLGSIKNLQFGNLAVLPEFEMLIQKITELEQVPPEYKEALGRIRDLFKLQLSVDPKLENTQMSRPYQFGDITFQALNNIHQRVNGSIDEEESLKDYEFGDISWGILNRINQSREGYQFGNISYAILSRVHQTINGNESDYRFGDITSGLLSRLKSKAQTTELNSTPVQEETVTKTPGYRFGDITRHLIWGKPPVSDEKPQEEHNKDSINSNSIGGLNQ
ncbi:hypothetical protein [Legionella sp. km772]|uniref:hypothetical protein n=1 Tax=Legionella sp. km772 TaxID=2498111 RepID=UPI000F8DCBE6|nr:hypothetical protein [Legionella sp. km772]RUR12336.1 hypothetical protein ELY15_05415 [Legionella sp. km772]